MYVNVALNIPADRLFTYEVPANLSGQIAIGSVFLCPSAEGNAPDSLSEISDSCSLKKVRPIAEILDEETLFGGQDLQFYKWITAYFMYPLGKTLAELIPAGSEKKDFLWITPLPITDELPLPQIQGKLRELLRQYPQGITLSNLTRISKMKNILPAIRRCIWRGFWKLKKSKTNKSLCTGKKLFYSTRLK